MNLTQTQIEEALKGHPKYDGASTYVKEWEGDGYYKRAHPNRKFATRDAILNAALVQILSREVEELKGQLSVTDSALAGQMEQLEAMFREAEELRAKLQAQHQATWAMALEAAAKIVKSPMSLEEFYMNKPLEYFIRALPCPPLETKGEE